MNHRSAHNKYEQEVHAELDLHGYTALEARAAVDDLLHEASQKKWGRVRIIVGKGLRSVGGVAVLPDAIKAHLNMRGITYSYAKLQDGGEGALEIHIYHAPGVT